MKKNLFIVVVFTIFTLKVSAQGIEDFPNVEGLIGREGLNPYSCEIGNQNEIRLDNPTGTNKNSIVTTGVIDQGQVGDCYAAAAVTMMEAEFNRRGIKNEKVSYIAAAVQAKIKESQKEMEESLKVLAQKKNKSLNPGEPQVTTESIKRNFLTTILPESFVTGLSADRLDKVYAGMKSISEVKDKDATVLDGSSSCQVINTLSEDGYCPQSSNAIEQSMQIERTKNYQSLNPMISDRGNIQATVVKSIEKFYFTLLALKSLGDNNEKGVQSEAQNLYESWSFELKNLTGSERLSPEVASYKKSVASCGEFSQINHDLELAIQDLRSVSQSLGQDFIKNLVSNFLDGINNSEYSLEKLLLSSIVPECDESHERKKIKPSMSCVNEKFPSFKVNRTLDQISKQREKIWVDRMGSLYDSESAQHSLKNSICKRGFVNGYANICKPDGSLISKEQFIKSAVTKRKEKYVGKNGEGFEWVTQYEKENYLNTKAISSRVTNITSVVNEFDNKVLSLLKNGQPAGLSICDAVLSDNFSDGLHGEACSKKSGAAAGPHAVVVVGVRKSAGGCQYLIKDSRGPKMNYSERCQEFNNKDNFKTALKAGKEGGAISKDCEPGLIWIPADQIAINTEAISSIEIK